MLYTQTIVILRAPLVTNQYRDKKRDWDAAVPTTVEGVNVQPAGAPPKSEEDTVDRQTTVTQWRLFTPRGMDLDLLETDRVLVDGMTLEVDGKVGRWPAPGGGVHHIEANLLEVD